MLCIKIFSVLLCVGIIFFYSDSGSVVTPSRPCWPRRQQGHATTAAVIPAERGVCCVIYSLLLNNFHHNDGFTTRAFEVRILFHQGFQC